MSQDSVQRSDQSALAIELADGQRQAVTVTIRPQAINVMAGHVEPSYSFDRAGRLLGAFVAGCNYRRSLDNRVLAKWREPGGQRQRRWLTAEEAQQFLGGAYDVAGRVAAATGRPELATLAAWDWPALQADALRFRQIYRPVSILPPDQYLALVLQATEGCSYNHCTFCNFYRDRSFRIKSAAELRAHIAAVAAFFGPALPLRKSLFLADANALVAPMARLRAWLDVIAETQIMPRGGLYSFIDAFDVERKSADEWHELAARGLRRVYIGLESGADELLRFLRKPGCAADAVQAVALLKAAGVAASVIVMTGIGGDRHAEAHVTQTTAVLAAMPLTAGDIVYFSPFVDQQDSEYNRLAADAGIRALTDAEILEQETVLRAAFRPAVPAHPPQLARYDIREFIY